MAVTVILDGSSMRHAVRRRPLWWRIKYHRAVVRRIYTKRGCEWNLRQRIMLWRIAFDWATS